MKALGCEFDPRQRGLFLWGRIPQGEASSETLADRVLYGSRVFITPGFIYSAQTATAMCAFPMRYRGEDFAEALKRIEETYKTA